MTVWSHDWRSYVRGLIAAKGFESVLLFVKANEGTPYSELAESLGEADVAPAQLQELLHEEVASDKAKSEYYCRSSFVRYLRQYTPNGVFMHDPMDLSIAVGIWAGSMGEAAQPRCRQIARRMRKLRNGKAIPFEWLPESPEDPVIEAVFLEKV